MLRKFLRNLRQKPKAVRNNIALGIAGVFTALVFSVWVYHVPARMDAVTAVTKEDDSAAFTDLFSNMKDQLATIKESSTSTSTEAFSTTSLTWAEYKNATATPISTESFATNTAATTSNSYTFSTTSGQMPAPQSIRIVTVSAPTTTATTTDGR